MLRFAMSLLALATAAAQAQVTLSATPLTQEQVGAFYAARTAFRWSQFPPEQEFGAGDWIMGMAALARRPPGQFSLIARYHDDKGQHENEVSVEANAGSIGVKRSGRS